ncbi:hypothetical protein CcaverHIS002_0705460 [Cutaneotrichosporon cavernicola]|uniref:Ankyrin n=1 Tax=Cutaneotrichosporon cavernicola TaxID=279322 RepID=A0AA48LAE7_9TREE|nr:uncharacterized protein CcaverHIS019_0705500 [Cutaneotrichosporon cavernicola]BEI87200.1 hypothetical protein CcaverHIS002_0705460 [Cutaneotrichosporon cavernicola]BEI94969.1 hypothetical protein CcaverHIS019_0705500 [Cutaneotrichosporon cavernicola]BEJ02743.1 hypothetical protein CcaverHIS631_0705380 [Cutaneotrichosporon cavernicola]BEJ10496.1 hypothetical protein CcaverHIS641_0705310 [Cutaneotrichosporon cavernicola]
MVQTSQKNLWVAASDGDIERVRSLIAAGATANDRDAHSYTPMHAAASYAHLQLLEYLVSVGGNVNLPDDDGDTPLFTCESVDAARWLVEHGAEVGHRNAEGVSAAESLADDQPAVAAYLRSLTGDAGPEATDEGVSQHAMDAYASRQTNDLLAQTQAIMAQAERDGSDPDAALREVVGRAVREGFSFGAGQGGGEEEGGTKRSRQE